MTNSLVSAYSKKADMMWRSANISSDEKKMRKQRGLFLTDASAPVSPTTTGSHKSGEDSHKILLSLNLEL